MTFEIGLVLAILVLSLALFVSEKLRMDVIALLVMGSLVLTELVTPPEAVAGFSNPAVIAVWAMFILSSGLTRTGIADVIGSTVLRLAGRRESRMIIVIMLTAGGLSAFMNNIGVAALMLPVVVDIARRTRLPVSRLLMPLAYGSLLGGLTTLIGTPPNLLISGALEAAGYAPFGLFDFTPIGGAVLVAGTTFIALAGRFLLPRKKPEEETQRRSQRNLRALYGLQSRAFEMKIPGDSILVGKTLGQSRIGVAAGLIVIALERYGRNELMPSRQTVLQGGDKLLVQGRLDRFSEFQRWSDLVIEREAPVLQALMAEQVKLVEATVAEDSNLVAELLHHSEFRDRHSANVLAIKRGDLVRRVNLANVPLRTNDVLLLQATPDTIEELERSAEFSSCREVDEQEVSETYRLQERIFVVRVPHESQLAGDTLVRSRLGDAFDFRLLALFRDGELTIMPEPDQSLKGGDLLLIQGREEDLDVLRGLQELEIQPDTQPNLNVFESDRLNLLETTLDPRSSLVGRPASEINFRAKYGLELVAVWRKGEAIRTNLDRLVLQFGDALLLLGPRQQLALLERDPDFLVLTPVTQRQVDTAKAPLAAGIMFAVIFAVLTGWLPIYIAAVIGATLMVVTNCLTMEDAYRAIEWRAIFLIAGMLPLGTAMEQSGAATFLAEQTMALLGPFGPMAVIAGLYLVTAAGTMIIPTAALVVLMAPIVLSASADLGIAPQTAMMAVAMAASASFTSPISHPANILVMGPGGYRFADYLKLGLPLTAVVFVTVMVLLPIFWPLSAATP
ncbi:MAG: SLC13 family permease [Gammaproteobacteria bacterium]|nr:SLC13 family permease [Gammaproteobacteria bacterium]MDH3506896.1 SLC13 family permease [Gammaproteobacteria bacterium]